MKNSDEMIFLNCAGNASFAKIIYHRNGEFMIRLASYSLKHFREMYGPEIEINFNFNIPWAELVLQHLVAELAKYGFSHIKLILPYFPFSRANKPEKELGCKIAILDSFFKMLKNIGIKEITTYDFHLGDYKSRVCGIKFNNVRFSEIWSSEIERIAKTHINDKFLVFSPDKGAEGRAMSVYNELSMSLPSNPLYCKVVYFHKERKRDKLNIINLDEEAKNNTQYHNRICIIADDIIDSGKTITRVAEEIKKFNPKKIYVLATHLLDRHFVLPGVDLFNKFY